MNLPMLAQFKLDYGAFQLNVDLALPNSGITVFFGHSGSGKTTLLRCIAGLQHAPVGFLNINGQIWQDSTRGIFLPTHQRNLGYVFQEANLFAHLSVRDNLYYGLKRIRQRPDSEHFTQVIELLGINHLMARMPARLSGGERQRVAIARALVLNPDILLMDEPLASLDSQRKQEILPFLTALHHKLNIPVLYVTHSQQEVAQLADFLVILKQGQVQAAGTLTDTLSRLDVALSGQQTPTSVWSVTVTRHDVAYRLTEGHFADGVLLLPGLVAKPGALVRVQIDARDVSLSLEKPLATSILNVLPAVITAMADDENGHTLVQLRLGTHSPLLAQITTKSAQILNLHVEMPVYAQIKGTSLIT